MAGKSVLIALSFLAVMSFESSSAVADGPASVHAGASATCPDPVKGRKFDDDALTVILSLEGLDPTGIHCSLKAENENSSAQNKGQKGIKADLTLRFENNAGAFPGSVNTSLKTDNTGYDSFDIDQESAFFAATRVHVEANVKGSKKLSAARLNCAVGNRPPCMGGPTTLCLGDGNRFQVEAQFGPQGIPGQVFNPQRDEGILFNGNTDLLVQLLDRCSNNDHFWVFAGATTNVEVDLTVTDTVTGASRTYGDQLGQPAQAITDTSAFATCP
jgi:hypothetical protein